MQYKYCVNFKLNNKKCSSYFRGNNPNQALLRCLKKYNKSQFEITKLEIIGDALPVAKDFAAKQIIKQLKEKTNKQTRWKAALKYQKKSGFNTFELKPKK
jgi:hypothetical protein